MFTRAILLTLAGTMLLGATCFRHDDFQSNKYALKGVVTDKSSGEPLIGVSVWLRDSTIGALTDIDGRYKIRDIQPGEWTIKATSVGYESIETTLVIVKGVSLRYDFTLKALPYDRSKTIK